MQFHVLASFPIRKVKGSGVGGRLVRETEPGLKFPEESHVSYSAVEQIIFLSPLGGEQTEKFKKNRPDSSGLHHHFYSRLPEIPHEAYLIH